MKLPHDQIIEDNKIDASKLPAEIDKNCDVIEDLVDDYNENENATEDDYNKIIEQSQAVANQISAWLKSQPPTTETKKPETVVQASEDEEDDAPLGWLSKW